MRPVCRLITVAAAGLALTACASPRPAQLATTPTEQWTKKVEVVSQPETIRLAVHSEGVSSAQAAAIAQFVGLWMSVEGGEIVVQAPVGASPRMISAVNTALVAQGAPASAVSLASYDAGADLAAPIVVGFERYQAITPKCGLDWENLTRTRNNEVYRNFGCAVTANIAAQIANPEDLLRPRASTPVDAQRRAYVLDRYRKGQTTSSARDDQAVGTVSRAIN